MLLHIQLDTQK